MNISIKPLQLSIALLFLIMTLNKSYTQTWTGSTSTDWAEPTNWSTGMVPTDADHVIIPNVENDPVIMDGTAALAQSMVLQGGAILMIENGGSLTINGSTGNGITNNGSVHNHGDIILGATTNIAGTAIQNQGGFRNYPDGNIEIDGTNTSNYYAFTGYGIRNNQGKTFINEGTLIIALNKQIGNAGIHNFGAFRNDPGGYLQIEQTRGNGAIYNEGGTFTNSATIILGSVKAPINNGITNESTFNNNEGAILEIGKNSSWSIYNDFGANFNNRGLITTGLIATGGIFGVFRSIFNGNNFRNYATGVIQCGASIGDGIRNNSGHFRNWGTITVGATAKRPNEEGIAVVGGTFTNEVDGFIEVVKAGDRGIANFENFNNKGKIIIGGDEQPNGIGYESVQGSFTNFACGAFILNDNFSMNYNSSFTNNGLLVIDSDNGHTKSASTFTNNGVLSYLQPVFIPGVNNNEIIIQPTTSAGCGPITSAFLLGPVNFDFLGVFSDEAATVSAGTYTQGNNTFVDNPELADGATYTLYVNINDPTGDCTRSVPWSLTIDDVTPPTFTCPANVTVDMAAGTCHGIVPDFNAVINDAADNCGNVIINQDVVANSNFGSADGDQVVVNITADDGNGNVNATPCAVTLTLNDAEYPTFACPGNLTIDMNQGMCSGTIPDFAATIMDEADNCGLPTITQSVAANSNFGSADGDQVMVTITADDGNGNQNSAPCQITLTLKDQQDPSFTCPANQMVSISPVSCEGTVPDLLTGIVDESDNCGTPTLSQDIPSGTPFGPDGGFQVIVTITADDGNGNQKNCVVTISTTEDEAPNAVCQDVTLQLDTDGNASTTTQAIGSGSSDNCGIQSIALSQRNFDCQNIGNNVVTLTIIDFNDNSSTCSATVVVQDNIAPTALCKSATVQLDANGNGSITPMEVNNGSSDACGVATVTLNKENFSCSDVGNTNLALTVIDLNDNSNTCSATVTIEDNIAPTALCQAVTVELDATGNGGITENEVNNGSVDACEIQGIEFSINSKTNYSCSDVNANIFVTLSVTDMNNNTNTCTASIVVEDNIAPTVTCQDITINTTAGNCDGAFAIDPASATDNCGIAVFRHRYRPVDEQGNDIDGINWSSWSTAANGTLGIGDWKVQKQVEDVTGNEDECSFLVKVIDEESPAPVCLNPTYTFNGETNFTIPIEDIWDEASSSDNCGSVTYVGQSLQDIGCEVVGTEIPITVQVEDENGNPASCTAIVTIDGLPCGWQVDPAGLGCEAGIGTYDSDHDVFALSSETCYDPAYYRTQDQHGFIQQELCGDGEIIAQVTEVIGTGWAGISMRESNAPNARMIQLMIDGVQLTRREIRTSPNSPAFAHIFQTLGKNWLKLSRTGNEFTAYHSIDGQNWQIVFATLMPLGNCLNIGLITMNNTPGGQVIGIFENVFITESNTSSLIGLPETIETNVEGKQTLDISVAPNPFSTQTSLQVFIPESGSARIVVLNLQGQVVRYLHNGFLDKGNYQGQWDGTNQNGSLLPSGVYFVQVHTDQQQSTQKVFLQR